MAVIKIKKGLDIKLEGLPAPDIREALQTDTITICPQEFKGIQPRLKIQEGDRVKRGSVLFFDKKNEAFQFRSPAAGIIQSIVLGPRRSIEQIIIDLARDEEIEPLKKYGVQEIPSLSRDEVLSHLFDTGYMALIKERPFSKLPNRERAPKSIFVNGMNTAPFQPDVNVVLGEQERFFQAGLDLLSKLTKGDVHLCVGETASLKLKQTQNVKRHTFSGPHPSGNASVHIHFVDPISPGDTVWVIKAVDTILLGQLFLEGAIPSSKIISVGGGGIHESARAHYRVRQGGSLRPILEHQLAGGFQRILSGDVLSGRAVPLDRPVPFLDACINVIPESEERFFMGWLMPGLNRFSHSSLFLSRWFRKKATWSLNTNQNGSIRAMVMTGWYDKFMPMNIKVDFLVRAVLAHDTDEAIKLGILETDPEDFALCSFVCPSKMDFYTIIKNGLEEIEREGL
ncbi:MAG: Na(+)-translocating NADH-quinone reductase subunit A [Kiritimatiellae bacterium]|nr:Na(+)-translocating NADH-quinone reductase subunit A [Kiritimatiellia bacterium]